VQDNPPLDRDEYRRWRDEAGQALIGARLQAEGGIHNWACFGAEQASQLALKGLLHGLGKAAWGHDLVDLGRQVNQIPFDVPGEVAAALRRLEKHYIPARYPDAHPSGPPGAHYADSDSNQAFTDADLVLSFTDQTWEALSNPDSLSG